jgi:hypothetical protein
MLRSIALTLLLAAAPGTVQSTTLRPAQLQQDFDVLKRALEEAHGGLYRYTPKPELDKTLAASRARLDRPMTPLEFGAVLSDALAAIRDGHTRLEYDEATTKALASARLLPLRLAHEGGRLVVVSNDSSADRTIRPGMELVSVNGRAVASIVGTIAPKMPADGFIETGKAWRLARGFAQNYWLYVEQASTFTVTATDASGRTVSAALEGVTNADRAKVENPVNAELVANLARLEGSRDNVSLHSRTVATSGSCASGLSTGHIRRVAGESLCGVARQKDGGLILDLRGNGGV